MSMVVASGTLDTVWSEFETVVFTAGTLATISDCITEVESKLQRGTLTTSSTPKTTDVIRWLIRAKQELSEIKNFTFKRRYVTATTVPSQFRYSLPPDYNGGQVTIRDVTNDRILVPWPAGRYDLKYPDPSLETNNEPLIICIKNMEVWLAPPPDGAYVLEAEYGRSGADEVPTDFSWLPEVERFRCCDFAAGEGFLALHMWQPANVHLGRWGQGLKKAIRADGKRKWRGMNYQVISAFQEGVAYNNQQDYWPR